MKKGIVDCPRLLTNNLSRQIGQNGGIYVREVTTMD